MVLQTSCISAEFFLSITDFFLSFTGHLGIASMFRVVDVLRAVSYTVAEDEWIFSLCYGFFPVCHMVYTVQ